MPLLQGLLLFERHIGLVDRDAHRQPGRSAAVRATKPVLRSRGSLSGPCLGNVARDLTHELLLAAERPLVPEALPQLDD